MELLKKINFRQPKYMIPAILYLPTLFLAYFVLRFFSIEKAEVDDSRLETTEYINDKLPDANIKGDGIGDKFTNMLNDFGKIKDVSAVENIERGGEDQKEEYTSQYQEAEIAVMEQQSEEARQSMERLRKMQEQLRGRQEHEDALLADSTDGITPEEKVTLEELHKALEEARMSGQPKPAIDKSGLTQAVSDIEPPKLVDTDKPAENAVNINEDAVTEIPEEAEAEEVVKKKKETSSYFNTITTNEPEHRLIRAIVDEEIKAVEGSRVRLRLLDEVDIGERTVESGTCLYCMMSGFSQQRVKGTVKSLLLNDELVKVNLSLYDTDGLEGLYVPKSSFRETSQDVASGAFSQSMSINDGSANSSMSRWGMQALQNAYQKSANAISKNIRKNRVKIKYGTQVYLINSREQRK